jgi:hypothetical protein
MYNKNNKNRENKNKNKTTCEFSIKPRQKLIAKKMPEDKMALILR